MIFEFPHQYATLNLKRSLVAKIPPRRDSSSWGIFRL